MVREWEAQAYDALPLPHVRWAGRTLRRFEFTGDETVLEAGCGTGRDTAALLDLRGAVADVLGEDPDHWDFAGPEETRERLERAGFTDAVARLRPDPARLEEGEQFRAYLATVVLGAHLDRLPPEDHDGFVGDVAAGLGEPVVDYVRLEFSARRAG